MSASMPSTLAPALPAMVQPVRSSSASCVPLNALVKSVADAGFHAPVPEREARLVQPSKREAREVAWSSLRSSAFTSTSLSWSLNHAEGFLTFTPLSKTTRSITWV